MSSTDGLKFPADITGASMQNATASDASTASAAAAPDASSPNAISGAAAISPIEAAAIVNAASNPTPPDLGSLSSNAYDAITSGALSGISLAALGEIGNYVVTAERLIATMPPYLGSGVDMSA